MRFLDALRGYAGAGRVPVIPDFKMISPAEGALFAGRDVIDAAAAMASSGAPALSVVTEPKHFGGSRELLTRIAGAVNIPILRKDFVKTPEDIEETAEMGADAVLLICSTMEEKTLRELYHASLELGIDALVETHSEAELRFAASLGAELVGINNRDILALERDGGTVHTTAELSSAKPEGAFLISESGIRNAEDIQAAIRSGADAVLIGTAIWKAADPAAYYTALAETKV